MVAYGPGGRPSNRALSRKMRERKLAIAAEPAYANCGPTPLCEHLESGHRLRVNPYTLRRWMPGSGSAAAGARSAGSDIATGTRTGRDGAAGQRGARVPKTNRTAGEPVLIAIHDDATRRLMVARFLESDNRGRTTGVVDSLVRPR